MEEKTLQWIHNRKAVLESQLKPKRVAFARAYSQSLNAADAARQAGYATHSEGSRLMQNADVLELINLYCRLRTEQAEYDEKYIIQRLMHVVEVCTSESKWNPTGANRALELLGKTKALFTDKSKVEGDISIQLIDSFDEENKE